jgi:TP901 family phage tail tape measure protein
MGFAGQVFAARVAIGLAVPSPQAMQKTGTVLATAIQDIGKRVAMAQKSVRLDEDHKSRLSDMNKWHMSTDKRMKNQIVAGMHQHLTKMNNATKQGLSASVSATKMNVERLRAILSKPLGDKLTAGLTQGAGGMRNTFRLGANIAEMTRAEHTETLRVLDEEIALQDQLYIDKVKLYAMDDKEENQEKNKQELLDQEESLRLAREFRKEVAARIGVTQDLTNEMRDLDDIGKQWLNTTLGTVDVIRSKFNEALRNTIAILTALAYKLNQNTQELVDFERELLNANSVFGLTNDKLFEVGNTVVEFGNEFGIATQNGAAGLYQLASAGLTANEAMKVLPHTLKLSMAVQGDHNTISKLTAQTIFGFGMEMESAAQITDKFAYAIQKSLIEYQDLSSAVKFALPFFTSTGQSIDQLLGALQILTNRALEAGIAGRGLRQALAEFAESAMDAEAGFRKMGVEILNAEGEMLQLSEIASQFAAAVGPETIGNTELLTILIEELNVRGATAFIHLVQASDEFTEAVKATEQAGGELDRMVKIQNESLSAQIQILKTNIFSIFAFRDAAYEGTEFINGFHKAVVSFVESLRDLIIMEENGQQQLTEFGKTIQEFGITMVEELEVLTYQLIDAVKGLMKLNLGAYFKLLLLPLKIIAGTIQWLDDVGLLKFVILWKTLKMMGIPQLLGAIGKGMLSIGTAGVGVAGLGAGGMGAGMAELGTAGYLGATLGVPGVTKASQAAALTAAGIHKTRAGVYMLGGTAISRAYAAELAGVSATSLRGLSMGGRLGGMLIPGLGMAMTAWLMYDLLKYATKGATGGYLTPMAGGGMAGAGSPYLVGEQGPELFMPGTSGQLLNNGQTNSLMGGPIVLRNVSIGIDSFGGLVE